MRGIFPNIHPGRVVRCRTNGKKAGDDIGSTRRIIQYLSRQRTLALSLARHLLLHHPVSAVDGVFPDDDAV